MSWRLRRASEVDAAAAALVAGATFLETFAGILTGPDIVTHVARKSPVSQFAAWTRDPASIVTLADHAEGDAPIGYSVLTVPDLPFATDVAADIELRRIYALSRFHGTGMGAALMARAVEDACALRKQRLWLGVLATNGRARSFYEKQGFRLAGERRFLVGSSWFDDVVYVRDL